MFGEVFYLHNVRTFNLFVSVSAVCIRDGSRVISGGQMSRKLSFKDHVLELTYEGGSDCNGNPELKHSSSIHFICRYLFIWMLLLLLLLSSFQREFKYLCCRPTGRPAWAPPPQSRSSSTQTQTPAHTCSLFTHTWSVSSL